MRHNAQARRSGQRATRGPEKQAKALLKGYVGSYEKLEKALARAYVRTFLSPDPTASRTRERLEMQLYTLHANPSRAKAIRRLQTKVTDPLLRRRLLVASRQHRRFRKIERSELKELVAMESVLERKMEGYVAVLGGARVSVGDIEEILSSSRKERRLKRAWRAGRKRGRHLAKLAQRVVKKRNAMARKADFADAYEERIRSTGLRLSLLLGLLKKVEKATRKPYLRYKKHLDSKLKSRFGVSLKRLRPWHYGSLHFDHLPKFYEKKQAKHWRRRHPVKLVEKTFAEMGFKVGDLLKKSDLLPRPGKSDGAYCARMDREGRVRIFASIRNDRASTRRLIHEVGHAVYFLHVHRELPFLLREPPHLFVTEGVAMMMEKVMRSATWWSKVVGFSPGDAQKKAKKEEPLSRFRDLLFVRWACLMVAFERALYKKPNQDLDALWWRLSEKFLGIGAPRKPVRGGWAAEPYPLLAPGYYQNYLLGELLAWQILEAYRESRPSCPGGQVKEGGDRRKRRAERNEGSGLLTGVLTSSFGGFLKQKMFRLGARFSAETLTKKLTGKNLSPEAFAKHHGFIAPGEP